MDGCIQNGNICILWKTSHRKILKIGPVQEFGRLTHRICVKPSFIMDMQLPIVGLEVQFGTEYLFSSTLYVRNLTRQHRCSGLLEPSLNAHVCLSLLTFSCMYVSCIK